MDFWSRKPGHYISAFNENILHKWPQVDVVQAIAYMRQLPDLPIPGLLCGEDLVTTRALWHETASSRKQSKAETLLY